MLKTLTLAAAPDRRLATAATLPNARRPGCSPQPAAPSLNPFASGAEQQAAMRAGTLTSEALVQAYLARIADLDRKGPRLNAVIALNPHALADARKLDAERKAGRVRGPLHGIPVLLKDNIESDDGTATTASACWR